MTDDNYQPPGWYYGAGDPPGTNRYWDGEVWVGDAVPVPSATPAPPTAPGNPPGYRSAPAYGATPAYGAVPAQQYPEKSGAVGSLILGILGLVCCQLASPFAWKIGSDEIKAIDAGRRPPKDRGLAMAGKILGIIGTLVLALAVLGILVAIVAGSFAEPTR